MKKVLDLSHWNGSVNLNKARDMNIEGVVLKASQGTTFVDPKFYTNRDKAVAAGLPWAAYHYYEARTDPILQAKHFCKVVNDVPRKLVADIEDSYAVPSGYATRVYNFLLECENITGYRPAIYTRESYWKLYLSTSTNWADFYELWVAHYKNFSGPLTPMPWTPEDWVMWQFTDRASGAKYGTESLQVDLNVARDDFEFSSTSILEPTPNFLMVEPEQARKDFPFRAYLQEKVFSRKFNPRKD